MIADYLAELADALSFDRRLARRVRREVEDHLREAVAEYAAEEQADAERRAIASFGDPRALARQFAAVSLARRTRHASIAVVLAVIAVLVAMKVRIAWYAAAKWTVSEDVREFAAMVLTIDRYAFWLSVIVALSAVFYIGCLRVPAVLQPHYCRRSRHIVFLCAAAALSLVVSVISDGVLTGLQFTGESREGGVVPLVSMAAEIVCVAAVILLIAGAVRQMGHTGALART